MEPIPRTGLSDNHIFLFRPARLHRLAESIPGLLKSLQIRAQGSRILVLSPCQVILSTRMRYMAPGCRLRGASRGIGYFGDSTF